MYAPMLESVGKIDLEETVDLFMSLNIW